MEKQKIETSKKFLFIETKNDYEELELFVDCTKCGRKWHKICALQIDQLPKRFRQKERKINK
jgi:hypothetical protein